jgi:hypothetical protein
MRSLAAFLTRRCCFSVSSFDDFLLDVILVCLAKIRYLTTLTIVADDCNWSDHVGDINREFGVLGVRTPQGLTLTEFYRGLEMFGSQKR